MWKLEQQIVISETSKLSKWNKKSERKMRKDFLYEFQRFNQKWKFKKSIVSIRNFVIVFCTYQLHIERLLLFFTCKPIAENVCK